MPTPLPIDTFLPQIVDDLRRSRALVLVAEPGAGKTTRVPPAIIRSQLLSASHPNLLLLQPRRVAARAAAMRIADENQWQIGNQVGWHVRFDKRVTEKTRLRVLTEGILTRQLLDDPFLEGVGAVILDEFHERSIHTDLSIALLREVRQTVRDDLLLIVMSATLDAEPISRFLEDCPIVRVPGRTFPVQIDHSPVPSADPLALRMRAAITDVLPTSNCDILAFLPGVREIGDAAREIIPAAAEFDAVILALHGSLSPEEQIRVIQPSDRRKIILATNIAETSLTIDGVQIVIDSGLARVAGFDAARGLDRLDLSRISQASAIQRAGRAGRTAAGRCIRLYTEKEFHAMETFELPEIHRVDLASTALGLLSWGNASVESFPWFDPPPISAIRTAEQLLEMLNAQQAGKITPLGKRMLGLPVHPRLARLLIAAAESGLADEGATIAALLSERDLTVFDRSPRTRAASDLLIRREGIRDNPNAVRVRDELQRLIGSIKPTQRPPADREEELLKLVLLAYPDRVCRRRESDPAAAVCVGGSGMRLAAGSVVRDHEFYVAVDARQDDRNAQREATVRIASAIEPAWLEELFPDEIHEDQELTFDTRRNAVVARNIVRYRDLTLREHADAAVDPQKAGVILAEALSSTAVERIASHEQAAAFLARLDLLTRAMPEQKWPTIDPKEVLAQMCHNKRSVADLERVSPMPFLESALQYPLDRLFVEYAPESIIVPSGSHIRIEYRTGQPPVLGVRLQELFGWTDTPRIASGRVPLVLHLLGPNFRPVQITEDLRSFWANAYFQVRKDLRVRYPKHSWPEDPLTAIPQAKGRHRR